MLRLGVSSMPHRLLNTEAVAEYLHLAAADVERLVKDKEIPFEKRGARIVFRKSEIDMWASQRILGLAGGRLAEYHQQSTRGTREILSQETLLTEMIEPGFIDPAMTSKTRASALRDLVALADRTGRVCDAPALLASLEAREALCSTALPEGFALPHPRIPEVYLFESSFVVVGRPVQEIHFGAPDGHPTHLFFLLCCQDDRIHLHTLARICLMAQNTQMLNQLRQAPDAVAMRECILTTPVRAGCGALMAVCREEPSARRWHHRV